MAQERQQSFMKGAAILTASTLIVKILGLLFSIPLANLIDTEGMSYFYAAYDVFAVFLALSTAGLPIAVSRMVGTAYSQGRKKEADRVFFVAFWLFFGIGLAGSLLMCFGAWDIAAVYGNPQAAPAIIALAPTMFFISIMSALRGYFQGRSNMVPTAVSQTIEAVTKVVIGVGLAVYILRQYDSNEWAAVGAIIGVSVSAFLGTLYLAIYKWNQNRRDKQVQWEDAPSAGKRELLIILLKFAIPITLGSCFLHLLDFIDGGILMNQLQHTAGFSLAEAQDMEALLGHARKFFDLPGAFVMPISTSLLPVLSGAFASGNREEVDHISFTSLRVTLLISIPASVGMCLFADPICRLLLAGKVSAAAGTAPLLSMLSVAIAFNSMLYVTNAILQSLGRPTAPVINMAVGGIVKITLSFVLIGVPQINVMGAAISTVASYALIMILNFLSIRRSLPNLRGMAKTAVPLLTSAAVMGAISYGAYWGMKFFLSPRVAVLPAIVIAIVVYAVCVVSFRAVSYDDVALLPKGETIARLLHIKKKDDPQE